MYRGENGREKLKVPKSDKANECVKLNSSSEIIITWVCVSMFNNKRDYKTVRRYRK